MNDYRFDGRTAIVTGAGGNPSLGRAYAMLLAARGANIVVNDIGHVPESPGYEGDASAEAVAAEIRAAGGKAVADTHSVATPEGARAMVETALDAFGSVDILVNNAAVSSVAHFEEMTLRDYRRHVEVNLLGVIWTMRAAWPHMKAARYGRIINIGSDAIGGMAMHIAYATTKGGVFALTRSIADAGAPFGILANIVHPYAHTRMIDSLEQEGSELLAYSREQMPAEIVAPVVGFLAHQDCPVSGECISAGGGTVRRVYLARTEGLVDRDLTIESLANGWATIMAPSTDDHIVRHGFAVTHMETKKPYRPECVTADPV